MSNVSSCCDAEGNIIMSVWEDGFSPHYRGHSEGAWLQWLFDFSGFVAKSFVPKIEKEQWIEMFEKSFHNGSLKNSVFMDIESLYDSQLSINLPIVLTIISLIGLMFVFVFLVYCCFSKKWSNAARIPKNFFTTIFILLIMCSLICSISYILILSSWNIAVKEYPDNFMDSYEAIDSDVTELFRMFIDGVEGLRKEQFDFTIRHIYTTLKDLPSLTFEPVDETINNKTSSQLNVYKNAHDTAYAYWKESDALFNEIINISLLINSLIEEGFGFSDCDISNNDCKRSLLEYNNLLKHGYDWERPSPLELVTPEVFLLSVEEDIDGSKSEMVGKIAAAATLAVDELNNITRTAAVNINILISNISNSMNTTISKFDPNDYLWNSPSEIRAEGKSHGFKRSFLQTVVLLLAFTQIFLFTTAAFTWLMFNPEVEISQRHFFSHVISLVDYIWSYICPFLALLYALIFVFSFPDAISYSAACSQLRDQNPVFLDEPFRINPNISSIIADSMLSNGEINLTLSSIISSCRSGDKFFESFLLINSAEFSMNGTLNVSFLLPNIDEILASAAPNVSDTIFLTPNVTSTLSNFNASDTDPQKNQLITTMDQLDEWISELRTGSPDFTGYCDNCKSVTDIVSNVDGFIASWADTEKLVIFHKRLKKIVTDYIPELETLQTDLRAKKANLDTAMADLQNTINNEFLPAVDDVQNWISSDANIILSENVKNMATRIKRYMQNYIDWVYSMLEENIAPCYQIPVLRDILFESGCSKTCDAIVTISILSWVIFSCYFMKTFYFTVLARGLYRDKTCVESILADPSPVPKSTPEPPPPLYDEKSFVSIRLSQTSRNSKPRKNSSTSLSESSVPEADRDFQETYTRRDSSSNSTESKLSKHVKINDPQRNSSPTVSVNEWMDKNEKKKNTPSNLEPLPARIKTGFVRNRRAETAFKKSPRAKKDNELSTTIEEVESITDTKELKPSKPKQKSKKKRIVSPFAQPQIGIKRHESKILPAPKEGEVSVPRRK